MRRACLSTASRANKRDQFLAQPVQRPALPAELPTAYVRTVHQIKRSTARPIYRHLIYQFIKGNQTNMKQQLA